MSLEPASEIMADMMFTGYLVWACRQDIKEMQVVRYTHLAGIAAIGLSIYGNRQQFVQNWYVYSWEVMVLFFISLVSKRMKLYGAADVICFFICSVFLLVRGKTAYVLEAYLWMQIWSGVLLVIVQIWKHNINGIKLRHSVPYIPYISVAFVLTNKVL